MLTIPTPTLVRDVPAEALDPHHSRKTGALGMVLSGDVIRDYVVETYLELYPDYYSAENPPKVRPEDMLLLRSPIGELAIIGTEGVGDAVSEDYGTVPAYVVVGWEYTPIQLPHDVIQRAITGEAADVAGFVRLFGGRLDSNAYIWRRFVGID